MCPSDRTTQSITTDESWYFRSAFEVIDGDGDGKIGGEDLRRFYSSSAAPPDEMAIKSMIKAADLNEDGFVEYEEFERAVLGGEASSAAVVMAVMKDVFTAMDSDGDGMLSHRDLKTYMAFAGFSHLTDDDIHAMIALANNSDNDHHHGHGHDHDRGVVSFQGLLNILAVGLDHDYHLI